MRVSFDFDSTLDRESVQSFAKELLDKGFEVWVVTTRHSNDVAKELFGSENHNKDLFKVVDKLGINRNNIHFTNHEDKWPFLKTMDFAFHLDDDWVELRLIQKNVKGTTAVSSFGTSNWKNKCLKAIIKKL